MRDSLGLRWPEKLPREDREKGREDLNKRWVREVGLHGLLLSSKDLVLKVQEI